MSFTPPHFMFRIIVWLLNYLFTQSNVERNTVVVKLIKGVVAVAVTLSRYDVASREIYIVGITFRCVFVGHIFLFINLI